ncbi:MAG: Ig-like domain-containing protein [Mediterranea sp.]|nr:Ig-like domain-containing protein [Mediterranea sp.]
MLRGLKKYTASRLVGKALPALAVAALVYSCASIGRPDGGPFDETPPRFLGSTPSPGALNNQRTKITLRFDEFIKLEKANEKVVVSPPQIQQPEIKASGKSIQVNLLDTLKPNTTYSIDFSDAIEDNNEGNPMGNFAFTFSTGEQIDSLEVSGTVLDASNLEPIKGILVGLHANLSDTAFAKLPFDRVGRTDSRGHFSIRGIAPGKYRIFALQDADQNFAFTQKSEVIAFNDSLVVPTHEPAIRMDTSWVDSVSYDTIIPRDYTRYMPDDLILRAFKEPFHSQYLVGTERLTPQKFTLYFNAKADTLPTLRGMNFDERDAFVIEKNRENDTINYWVRDSLLYRQDTLTVSLTYLYTDTLNQLVPRTDTLNIVSKQKWAKLKKDAEEAAEKEKKEKEKKKKKRKTTDGEEAEESEEPEPIKFLPMKVNAPSSMDVYGSISLTFDEPVERYDRKAIHLRQKVDTLWQDLTFDFARDTMDIRRFNLHYDWTPQAEYELSVDSTAFHGIYGLFTDKAKQSFKVRSEDEYFTLHFSVTGAGPQAFVELLDGQDKVVRRRRVVNGMADFYFLTPGKYGARLVNDTNGNGIWDTGVYETGLQPETVYYYPQMLEYKALWDVTQPWDVHATAVDKQKPDELKKQKPDEEKKKKQRERNNQNRRN